MLTSTDLFDYCNKNVYFTRRRFPYFPAQRIQGSLEMGMFSLCMLYERPAFNVAQHGYSYNVSTFLNKLAQELHLATTAAHI